MAIDYGTKRVGIAITDPLGIISQPLVTINIKSKKELIKRLKFIIEENGVGLILVGNPLLHSGGASKFSHEISKFANKLRDAVDVEVNLSSQSFTSQYAIKILTRKSFNIFIDT